jgi:hypothetical protein
MINSHAPSARDFVMLGAVHVHHLARMVVTFQQIFVLFQAVSDMASSRFTKNLMSSHGRELLVLVDTGRTQVGFALHTVVRRFGVNSFSFARGAQKLSLKSRAGRYIVSCSRCLFLLSHHR